MNDDVLKSLWIHGTEHEPLTREELDRIVDEGLERSSKTWASYVYLHIVALVATAVFGVLNVFGYVPSPPMLAAQLGVTIVAVALIPFGVVVLRELGRIDRSDEPVLDALRRRLRFYTTTYEIWLWVAGLTTALLGFTVSTYIDNQDGHYPINQPWVFWGTLVGVVLVIYASGKVMSYPIVREMCDALLDLREGGHERLERVPELRRKWLRWRVAAAVVMAVLAILGVLVALTYSPG